MDWTGLAWLESIRKHAFGPQLTTTRAPTTGCHCSRHDYGKKRHNQAETGTRRGWEVAMVRHDLHPTATEPIFGPSPLVFTDPAGVCGFSGTVTTGEASTAGTWGVVCVVEPSAPRTGTRGAVKLFLPDRYWTFGAGRSLTGHDICDATPADKQTASRIHPGVLHTFGEAQISRPCRLPSRNGSYIHSHVRTFTPRCARLSFGGRGGRKSLRGDRPRSRSGSRTRISTSTSTSTSTSPSPTPDDNM